MGYVIVFVVGVPLFALAFSLATLFLGLFWDRFRPDGPGGFKTLYGKFLIVAAVYIVLGFLGLGGLIGLAVMAFAYKTVFGAGWIEAIVIGIVGGFLGWLMIAGLLVGAAVLTGPAAG